MWARVLSCAMGLVVVSGGLFAAEPPWRVGLARAKITPEGPITMVGYAPYVSEGVLDELEAKAMAIEDARGGRAVLLTADLLFFRAPMAEALAGRIMKRTGLARRQILLNASHTHSGPLFGLKDPDRFPLTPGQRKRVDAYTRTLSGRLVDLVVAALADLKPARLSWGTGDARPFVMNRRVLTSRGVVMAPNPKGHVDREVPVLRVDGPDGKMRAVVFGCACHPVTLDGSNRKISGDYASFAQKYVERRHPGVQAMFVIGCAGDANSHPRGGPRQEQWVRQHGRTLAAEVCRVAAGKLQPVRGPLRAELAPVDLPLEHSFSREKLQQIATTGQTSWHRRNARGMLEMLDRHQPLPTHYRSSIAVWQFGDDLTLVGLPGEAVSDYAAMIRKALGPERLWVAAYCNESFGYLPTAEMLKQGGHETICLTLSIGFFSPDVQDVVVAAARELGNKAGRKPPP